jgi:hypothetical protein
VNGAAAAATAVLATAARGDTVVRRVEKDLTQTTATLNPHISQAFGFERLFCPASVFSAFFALEVAFATPSAKKSLRP